VQTDQPKVAWLMDPLFVIEKQTDVVGRVIALWIDLLVSDEVDIGVCAAEQQDQPVRHCDAQAAGTDPLELDRIGQPAEALTESPDRELDQHLPVPVAGPIRLSGSPAN
jgi:hypothetical protein